MSELSTIFSLYTMTQKTDPWIKALKACIRACEVLKEEDKERGMHGIRTNLEFLWDKYVVHPSDKP